MKKCYSIRLVILIVVCFNIHAKAQNYLTQSFDGAGIPTGWSNATYTTPISGCGSTYGCAWYREPANTGTPGPATHSGAGYMMYDSYSIDVGGTAELATPAIDFTTYSTGYNQVSFWMYREGTGFTYYDSIAVYINTSASSSGATRLGGLSRQFVLPPIETSGGWHYYTYVIPASFSGSTNYIIFKAFSDFGFDMYIDDVSVDHIPPCSGAPTISGITPAGPLTNCLGTVDTLTVNVTYATGLQYQWQVSHDTGTTWLNIINDTNQSTIVLSLKTNLYRAKVTCTSTGGSTSTAYPVTVFVNPGSVKYATLPYTQGFESWTNNCSTHDIPDSSWTISPASGDNSWRRDDEGYTYGSWTGSSGPYSPAYFEGSHSARFHSYIAPVNTTGEMEMYVNCSADTVHNKELRFYYYNMNGGDFLQVFLSRDSGLSYTLVGYLGVVNVWTQYIVPFSSRSPKTVFRFAATSDNGSTSIFGGSDIGLDYVQVVPPCTGKPTAGTITPVTACAGNNFNLSLTGTTVAADITYQWQSSTDSSSWTNMAGDTTPIVQTFILANTYFRTIVKCTASGQSDTSAGYKVLLRPFYYCYCFPNYPWIPDNPIGNIGNVTIVTEPLGVTILNNGTASPITNNTTAINSYSNFDTTITTPALYLDSSYTISITEISKNSSFTAAPVDIWIDYNHNGMFDDSEHFPPLTIYNSSSPTVTDSIHVPHTALTGITGMRVKLGIDEDGPTDPCDASTSPMYATIGGFIHGEYEDYLVNINYYPCYGPINAGRVQSTDTFSCNGYPFLLSDTTHEKHQSGITWNWQMSSDSVNWYNVPGTTNRDTVTQYFSGSVWYRVRMLCAAFNDTTYSDSLHIRLRPPYRCYCQSFADGGNADTSDIGSFSINGFVVNKGGTHLNNPAAIYSRQDFTNSIIDLWVDSVYTVNLFYIMHYSHHSDARITLFMDFDNNNQYDVPRENVWTGVTSTAYPFLLSTNIKIPESVLTSVTTGMRLIVNNNTAANIPSDYACGSYTSGETMDFAVRFHSFLGVNSTGHLQNVDIFPNPTNGKFSLALYTPYTVNNLQINITDMLGRQVQQYNYDHISGSFKAEMDMSNQTKGIYFVEFMADGERMVRKLVLN